MSANLGGQPPPMIGYQTMKLRTEHGAVFRGGVDAASFMLCRCGVPVAVGMEAQHEDQISHRTPADAGWETTVRRSDQPDQP